MINKGKNQNGGKGEEVNGEKKMRKEKRRRKNVFMKGKRVTRKMNKKKKRTRLIPRKYRRRTGNGLESRN